MGFLISAILSVGFIWALGATGFYILAIGVMFGVPCAIIANNKGRNSGWWFLVGFICWVIGLVIALVISKDKESIENNAIQKGEVRVCPFCAETVKTKAKVCKHCGKDLPEVEEEKYSSGRNFPISPDGLISAIRARDFGEAEKIISTDPSLVHYTNIDGLTPLHVAAIENQLPICKLLLSKGGSKSKKDNAGLTALGYAEQYGFHRLANILSD